MQACGRMNRQLAAWCIPLLVLELDEPLREVNGRPDELRAPCIGPNCEQAGRASLDDTSKPSGATVMSGPHIPDVARLVSRERFVEFPRRIVPIQDAEHRPCA